MKKCFIILLISLSPVFAISQSIDSSGKFGITLNSSFNGEVYPLRIIPTLTYTKGKNQAELGLGFHPFYRDNYRIISTELNHKHFPNGRENKFNMFFISQFSYINNRRDTFNPSTYNYLFLNAGYGFEIKASENVSIGMNVSSGVFTYSKKTEIPYPEFDSSKMFEKLEWNLAFQFSLGYRF